MPPPTNPTTARASRFPPEATDRTRPWAVVPVKAPHDAKTRLAPLLDRDERALLVEHMLGDVLEALAGSARIAGILVVTPDERVARLAERLGAEVLDEEQRIGLGPVDEVDEIGQINQVNRAIVQARDHLCRKGAARMLVIAGDLPLLSPAAVDRLVARAPASGPSVVVASNTDRTGTNALLCSPPGVIEPSFGPGSFDRHAAAAREAGAGLATIALPELELDLDEPADVEALLRRTRRTRRTGRTEGADSFAAGGCRTIRYLIELGAAERLMPPQRAAEER